MSQEPVIHATAIVEPGAELGRGVEVGPYALVGGQARIGDGCRILAHAQIVNRVELGGNCLVGRGAVLGEDPQSLGFDPGVGSWLRIGSGNTFREYVTIHRGAGEGSFTRIGADNFFMVNAHVGHDCHIGDGNVIANACLLGGHIELGDGAFLGGGAGFHQFCRIGDLAMVQGNGVMNRDIPPYTISGARSQVFGLNVIGLRRASIPAARRQGLKRAFELIYRSGLNLSQALEQAEAEAWEDEAQSFIEFFKAPSKQGICSSRARS